MPVRASTFHATSIAPSRPSSVRHRCEPYATRPQKSSRTLTGYDRVMVYRFDDEGHGEVFSEQRKPELEPYLGNRYPSSDIPQIARRLYERNRVRVLVDVGYDPVAVDAAALASERTRPRHVAVLPAQPIADPRPVSQEHGRVRDARRIAGGRRTTLGVDLLSPLCPAFRSLRDQGCVRTAG